jgi:hypothetical protein
MASLKIGKIDRVYISYIFVNYMQSFISRAILDLTYCTTDRSEKIGENLDICTYDRLI